MIDVRCRPKSGDYLIEIRGHTDPVVCAAVSGMVEAAVLGLKAMAATHPDKVSFAEIDAPKGREPP
ncbi:MAG TPA: ribosomal-processing cysteine protease Prp [Limnochordia bacterium]|nr:ribosomal-processing cysteine protease Prp [Limnochordia bacterium]